MIILGRFQSALSVGRGSVTNVSRPAPAIQFSLRNPRLHTILVGTASPENIKKNVKWLEEPLDEELLGKVQEILKPVQNCTWVVGREENSGGIRGYDAKYST